MLSGVTPRLVPLLGLLCALLTANPGCDHAGDGPRVDVDSADLNAVVLVIDAAGARHFGAYGSPIPASAEVDALAADAILFERAYSQAPWTLPSTASLLTGRYPPVGPAQAIHSETLAEILLAAGFRTAGFSENPYVSAPFGFDRGFEVFHSALGPAAALAAGGNHVRVDSAATVDRVLAWLDGAIRDRFFLYVHLLPPHAPYDPPAPFADRYDPEYQGVIHGQPKVLERIDRGNQAIDARDLDHLRREYAANLAFADHQLGRILDHLAERALLERTIVVVTSDHGEAFREHGRMLHNTTLYDEMIHVPLVVRFPARFDLDVGRVSGVVELRQLAPTLLDSLDVVPDAPGSLLPALRRGRPDPDAVARARIANRDGLWVSAVTSDSHKLIVQHRPVSAELYAIQEDPGERHDLASESPKALAALRARLDIDPADTYSVRPAEVDLETRNQLRALGYTE
jgi:arylsulfatase A-like enzyme